MIVLLAFGRTRFVEQLDHFALQRHKEMHGAAVVKDLQASVATPARHHKRDPVDLGQLALNATPGARQPARRAIPIRA